MSARQDQLFYAIGAVAEARGYLNTVDSEYSRAIAAKLLEVQTLLRALDDEEFQRMYSSTAHMES